MAKRLSEMLIPPGPLIPLIFAMRIDPIENS